MRNALIMGWTGSRTGRESVSMGHFQEVVGYLTSQATEGRIQGFEPIFLDPYGGTLQGFFLVRGTPTQLDALQGSEIWIEHVTRALVHLDGVVHVRATAGEAVAQVLGLWGKHLPQ